MCMHRSTKDDPHLFPGPANWRVALFYFFFNYYYYFPRFSRRVLNPVSPFTPWHTLWREAWNGKYCQPIRHTSLSLRFKVREQVNSGFPFEEDTGDPGGTWRHPEEIEDRGQKKNQLWINLLSSVRAMTYKQTNGTHVHFLLKRNSTTALRL